MITLYDYLPSQNAYKVRLLLSQLQLLYRTEIISIFEGEGQRPEYLAINPTGAVPAIKLDDGRVIAESNAILVFLADGAPYLPDDRFARAKVLQWLSFEGDYVQSTIATLRHWVMTGKAARRPAALVEAKREGSLKTLAILDRELSQRPWLAGPAYSVADIGVFAYVHRAEEADLPLPDFPNVTAWIDRVRSQPRFLAETFPYSIDPHSAKELP
ncbi:glutathione S-transferase family protein [Mycobacterium sp. KBS0706]|uniref:glutathione S-transferase family protein n=1 Tax=Mycobacterium sp. KBS0706 TaxID=2578109 RepID=UPI00110FBC69|nr:glutathione S-transferase family protein [Mycobacterium sp. KBS0706]TSD84675.1 glutathione S-transferase family protein [Mycobacterium sp. KBS0706]